jgi:hypothetical protein
LNILETCSFLLPFSWYGFTTLLKAVIFLANIEYNKLK